MTTVNQSYPPVAGYTSDTFNPDTAVIGGGHHTQPFTMLSNKALLQYEICKVVAGGIVQLADVPAAGDVLAIMCYAADNLTATSAGLRTSSAQVYRSGEFNQNKLLYPPNGTAANCKAIASACGLILSDPLVRN